MKRQKKLSARKNRQSSAAHQEKKRHAIVRQPIAVNNARRLPVESAGLDEWSAWKLSMRFPDGFYTDHPFACKDCGKKQVWKAWQQKRWFEQQQGDPDSTAVRCRECRVSARLRKAQARSLSEAGLMKKRQRLDKEQGS